MKQQTVTEMLRAAWPIHKADAKRAFELFDSWCTDEGQRRGTRGVMSDVPGMGTTERLAVRIYLGRTIEEAAACEYLYRWSLAIKAPDQCNATGRRSYDPRDHNPRACLSIFGAPHLLGM